MTQGRQTRSRFFSAGHLIDCALSTTYVFMLLFAICTFVHIPSFTLGFHPPIDQANMNMLLMISCSATFTWHLILLAFAEPTPEPQKNRVVWTPGNRV